MHAEDLVVNQGGDRQAVEHVAEEFPKLERVASLALVVETIDLSNLSALMIASN